MDQELFEAAAKNLKAKWGPGHNIGWAMVRKIFYDFHRLMDWKKPQPPSHL
jgi:hypothetical protein